MQPSTRSCSCESHPAISVHPRPGFNAIVTRSRRSRTQRCAEHVREEEEQRGKGEAMEAMLKDVRAVYDTGRTRSLQWRRSQLKALLRLLYEREADIFRALNEDLGKHHSEAYKDEVGILVKSVRFALDNLKKWMAPRKVALPIAAFPSTGEIMPEPLGVVLIFSSWNFPIGLSLEPLIGALTAGNAIVLKPSDLAPSSAKFLSYYISEYLDDKVVKVILGGQDVGEQLLEQKWDKIFFTGSPRVGRIVMTAAAKHLTPVTLELGGKCPAIFDSLSGERERKVAVQRLVAGKWVPCTGQACISVDYILAEEKFAPILVELLKTTLRKFYPNSDGLARIINERHFQRLSDFIKDPSVANTIVHGGSMDCDKLLIEPTILLDPPLDAEIMNEEIFGPLLPIITVKEIEESIEFIRARPKPLVIYAFTRNEKLKRRIEAETSSGSLTFNDTLIQFALDTLPFGGVGASGFGQYHGKFSFDMFSHMKAVLRRSFLVDFAFRYPPWQEWKLRFLRSMYHFDYCSLVLLFLGLKK